MNFKLRQGLLATIVLFLTGLLYLSPDKDEQGKYVSRERDITYLVPPNHVEPLWSFIRDYFKSPTTIDDISFQVSSEAISITDYYYDTDKSEMMNRMSYLRFRVIREQGGRQIPRADIMLTSSTDESRSLSEMSRTTLNLSDGLLTPPANGLELQNRLETNSLNTLNQIFPRVGVDRMADVVAGIVISQDRRRLIFKIGDSEVFSIVLDVSTGTLGGKSAKDYQLLIQPNDKFLSTLPVSDLPRYFKIQKDILAAIMARFKEITPTEYFKADRLYLAIKRQ